MKAAKITGILFGIYVLIVVVFESLLGYYQPQNDGTIIITTNNNGEPHSRVVSRIEHDDKLYVAANHWPRAWYYQVLENPELTIEMDGVTSDYRAIDVGSAEHDTVNNARPLPLFFRFLTGFPPRYFVRMDPR